jgi:hypothetical protein
MTNSDPGNGTNRNELLQRVELMETMIAEGRQSTARYGWMFVLWGVVYFAAVTWTLFLPIKSWAWPICVVVAIAISGVVKSRQKAAGGAENVRSLSIEAVWKGMGTATTLFVAAAVLTHHVNSPIFFATILFFIGMAHAISAMILRWAVQGAVAAIWWVGGIACFVFTTPVELVSIFLGASFVGMILFGLYTMMLERRRTAALVQHNA